MANIFVNYFSIIISFGGRRPRQWPGLSFDQVHVEDGMVNKINHDRLNKYYITIFYMDIMNRRATVFISSIHGEEYIITMLKIEPKYQCQVPATSSSHRFRCKQR